MKRLSTLGALLALVLVSTVARAQVPQRISYQGVLTDETGSLAPDGAYDITFRFFNVAAGGAVLHDETHVGVPVTRGGFSVLIGSVAGDPLTLPFTVPYWLEIQVAPDVAPLSPRIELASSPYAKMAETVPNGAITAFKLAAGAVQGGVAGTIFDNTISTDDILNGSITAADLGNSAVVGGAAGDVLDNSITTEDIANATITLGDMATNSVASQTILDNEVRSVDLLDEPGVVFDQDASIAGVTTGEVPVTVASVTITTPAGGHVMVTYGGYLFTGFHQAGSSTGLRASISETSAMQLDRSLSIAYIPPGIPDGTHWGPPLSKSVIYSKPAGTYTFRLICDNFGTEDTAIGFPTIQAVYFPSSYGTAIGGAPASVSLESPQVRAAVGGRR